MSAVHFTKNAACCRPGRDREQAGWHPWLFVGAVVWLAAALAGCAGGGGEHAALAGVTNTAGSNSTASNPAPVIGEQAIITTHLSQALLEAGEVPLATLVSHGKLLFESRFTVLDGQGRPGSTGGTAPRTPTQPAFTRLSGPDSNSCLDCHDQPSSGGAAGFVACVFQKANLADPVLTTLDPTKSLERSPMPIFGSGAIEMLAREMTAELQRQRAQALAGAASSGSSVTVSLTAKGIDFGSLTALPDGRIDPLRIEGVDWDLVIKPYHWKGGMTSLREQSNGAMNQHFGMQSTERFGEGLDADGDGKANELTSGDITALTIFQASLPVPRPVAPETAEERAAAARGEQLFGTIGCTTCHKAEMILDSPVFTEPGPYNPPGNLRSSDTTGTFSFDLTSQCQGNCLERRSDGKGIVRAFTDLKRHTMTDAQLTFFGNEKMMAGMLNGSAPASMFTTAPRMRPPPQFLTRRLWDVASTDPYGHRGDVTTLTGVIGYHGGESRAARDAFFALALADQAAVIEYLKTMQAPE
ncbi:MAG: hypothetical protein HY814_05975 [Candidatus Riflebacteria bacterium]|nr:hypothetical protein [Candidatus Riflebacteria bacterium]